MRELINTAFRLRPGLGAPDLEGFRQIERLDLGVRLLRGTFDLTATVRNTSTGESASVTVPYQLVSRLSGGNPHGQPHGASAGRLFSGTSCLIPNLMRVRFRVGEAQSDTTNTLPCRVLRIRPLRTSPA